MESGRLFLQKQIKDFVILRSLSMLHRFIRDNVNEFHGDDF